MNPLLEEIRAQRRSRGVVIKGPDRPVIASRPFDPKKIRSAQDNANARRWKDFHSRYAGQAEPLLQLWRA